MASRMMPGRPRARLAKGTWRAASVGKARLAASWSTHDTCSSGRPSGSRLTPPCTIRMRDGSDGSAAAVLVIMWVVRPCKTGGEGAVVLQFRGAVLQRLCHSDA